MTLLDLDFNHGVLIFILMGYAHGSSVSQQVNWDTLLIFFKKIEYKFEFTLKNSFQY